MRRPVIILIALALTAAGAACSKNVDTGFPSPTLSVPSPENTVPATAWTLTPQNIQWDLSKLYFEARKKTTVTIDNKDTAPHNFAIFDTSQKAKQLFSPDGKNVDPGQKGDYTVPGLKAGTYYFECEIHPSMNGSVTVS